MLDEHLLNLSENGNRAKAAYQAKRKIALYGIFTCLAVFFGFLFSFLALPMKDDFENLMRIDADIAIGIWLFSGLCIVLFLIYWFVIYYRYDEPQAPKAEAEGQSKA